MATNRKVKSSIPAKAKARAAQVNRLQRSSNEMGKFDNASATSVPMATGLAVNAMIIIAIKNREATDKAALPTTPALSSLRKFPFMFSHSNFFD